MASVPEQLNTTLSIAGPMERRQALGEGHDAFVQVAAVDVERGLLARHRLDDMGVGMTDAGHVVVHVDVAAAIGVEQVHALAADDVQRLVVEQRGAGSQRPVAAGGKCRLTASGGMVPSAFIPTMPER